MSELDITYELAAEIRRVDGSHELGAAELAEALVPWVMRTVETYAPFVEAAGHILTEDEIDEIVRHENELVAGEFEDDEWDL